jgi:adenine deaminase
MSSQIADHSELESLKRFIEVARGERRADLAIKNVEVVNVLTEEIYTADIAIYDGRIAGVGKYRGIEEIDASGCYAVPGLIDAHTHIEMSMLTVSEFARLVVPRGTTSVIADPHEIANVLGKDGVKLILEESRATPLKVYCLVPPCVPSSPLETSGAVLDLSDIAELLQLENILGIAEVMNFPGVVAGDEELLLKILAARGMIVDGHFASGGEVELKKLNAYIAAGIMSDHESVSLEEAEHKLRLGMRVMIREGSAARNLKALKGVAGNRYTMLVTDGDRDVIDLLEEGYLDHVFRRAVEEGIDPIKALQMLTINPAEYFRLNLGVINPGRCADVILLKKFESFDVWRVLVDGKQPVFKKFEYPDFARNTVRAEKLTPERLRLGRGGRARIIEIYDGEIVTGELEENVNQEGVDVERDILKAVAVERHRKSGRVGKALVRGFGLKRGAIAQSIAHDAHNIVAVGVSDQEICRAVNEVVEMQGGIAIAESEKITSLQLRVAGIMSDERAEIVAEKLKKLRKKIEELGCKLRAPFTTLSFIALPVIPKLKVTDLGLVDVEKFEIVDIFVEQ